MGFRNPFRVTLDKNDVAYVTDYSPDSQMPSSSAGPRAPAAFEIVRKPANYGWPLCYRTDLGYYKWDFNTSTPLPSAAAPEPHECDNPTRGPQNTSRWVASGGPRRAGPRVGLRSPTRRSGTRTGQQRERSCTARRAATRTARARRPARSPGLPAALPGAVHRRRRPARHGAVQLRPGQPEPDEVPALLGRGLHRRRVHAGHAARGPHGLDRTDPQDQQHAAVRSGPATPTRPWLCDNPMDMEFGPDGTFYLLTYGDGFFAINPDAGMMRWEYVKGLRAPVAVLTADETNGAVAADGQLLERGLERPRSGRLDPLRVGLRRQRHGRLGRAEPDVHLHDERAVHGEALRDRLERQGRLGEHDDHGRQHRADGDRHRAGRRRDVRVRRQHPVHGHGHRPKDGVINCRVEVTFVLGHDTHGHAQASSTGCTGVLPTLRTTSRTAATCSA